MYPFMDLDLLLRIDGHVRPLSSVAVLGQSDPYPGGHRFFMSYRGPSADQVFEGFSPCSGPVPEELNRDLLWKLQFLLSQLNQSRDPSEPLEYFLNKVDAFELEPGSVRIAGICSPVGWKPGAA